MHRNQCGWDRSGSRGGPCSRGGRWRTSVRPQESTWGQVQSHPGLICPGSCPYLPPLSLHRFLSFLPPKTRNLARLSIPQESWRSTDTVLLHIPKCIVLIPLSFGSRFVLFLLFMLTEALYVVCVRFKVCLRPCGTLYLLEGLQGSHVSSQPMIRLLRLDCSSTSCRWFLQYMQLLEHKQWEITVSLAPCSRLTPLACASGLTYECEKKHNCEGFYFHDFSFSSGGIIVVLSLHDVGILVLVIVLLPSYGRSHINYRHCHVKDANTAGPLSGKRIGLSLFYTAVTNIRLL